MKPEPLKNKKVTFVDGKYQGMHFFWKDSVASAVEWLKQEIEQESLYPCGFDKTCDRPTKEDILELIDQAFEDVMRNEKRNLDN